MPGGGKLRAWESGHGRSNWEPFLQVYFAQYFTHVTRSVARRRHQGDVSDIGQWRFVVLRLRIWAKRCGRSLRTWWKRQAIVMTVEKHVLGNVAIDTSLVGSVREIRHKQYAMAK